MRLQCQAIPILFPGGSHKERVEASMHLVPRFECAVGAAGAAIVALLLLLIAAGARAQLSADSPPPGIARGATTRYRDGGDWVEVERLGPGADGLTPVTCHVRSRRFGASIGRHAIVELDMTVREPERLLRALGLRDAVRLSRGARLYRVVGAAAEDGLAVAARLAQEPGLNSATPDLYLQHVSDGFAVPPDDEHYRAQWYLKLLEIETAWRIHAGDPAVKVAIVDTGCDMQHPDLAAAFVTGIDVTTGDDDPSYTPGAKGNEHGTACAGIVGAIGNNEIGVVGVCPLCRLICIRLFEEHKALVPISADITAFEQAMEAGAAVISNSWGFGEATAVPQPLRRTIERVQREGREGLGTVVVFAAGNENREIEADEIGAIPGVLNVGAVNSFEEAAPFSNFGPSVDLTAPHATFTTDISGPEGESAGDYTQLFGGTSAACPVVAGVAGLLLSADPNATAADVGDLLARTARPALYAQPDAEGHDPLYGHGMVAPAAALRELLHLPADAGVIEPAADAGVAANGLGDDAGCRAGSGNGGGWLACALALAALVRRRRA